MRFSAITMRTLRTYGLVNEPIKRRLLDTGANAGIVSVAVYRRAVRSQQRAMAIRGVKWTVCYTEFTLLVLSSHHHAARTPLPDRPFAAGRPLWPPDRRTPRRLFRVCVHARAAACGNRVADRAVVAGPA